MKDRSGIIVAVIAGVMIGVWFGLNHMRGQPWHAYPLAPPSASEELADGLLQAYQEAVDSNTTSH